MKRRPRPLSPALLHACLTLVAALASAASAPNVPRWEPHDFSFKADAKVPNPFMVSLRAEVKGPDGKSFAIPGFFDGDGTWKIRVAPNAEGAWSLVTSSDLKALDGQKVEFTCVPQTNPRVHGVLRTDPEHPHHFLYEDGTRFFPQGYEYDWLWALDAGKPAIPTIERTLDLISDHGFNYVILNTYAHDTGWRKGRTSDDDFGPPPLYAWEGSNEQPDHSRMNLAFWKHYDRVIGALHHRGMQAHILIKVYNKAVKWPTRGSAEEDLFFRWLVARYAAYPNAIWDFSKEAHNEKDLEYKLGRLRFLRENDPYHHLATVHDDDKANDSRAYDELTDFRADQQHAKWRDVILRQRARRAWPVVNVEFGYEHGPGGIEDKTYGKVQEPEEVVRRAWEIAMAGGYTAYYYTYTAWDVIRPLEAPKGYALFKHFGDFWRGTRYWTLEPAESLVDAGWCLADPGREYVVFLNQPGPFSLTIAGATAPLKAEWFHPHTGARTPAGTVANGTAKLAPPDGWGDAPLIFHATVPR